MDEVSGPLDQLTLLVVVDNETDTLSTVDSGVPQLPEMATHLGRVAPSDNHDGHPAVEAFSHMCVACHGFSALATGRRGEEVHTVLFDVGPYPQVWLDNAERLGVDLSTIEAIFLSHWHWDHSGALPEVVEAVATARSAAGHPPPIVDLHPDRPDQRGILTPLGVMVMLAPEPTLDSLRRAGGDVRLSADAHSLAGGFFLGSGQIPRVTAYETGLEGHHSVRDGVATPDPLILDERFLAATVAGRGATVLSACSHAGVVNACLGARESTGADIDLVLGGFHLAGAGMEARIDATVRDLRDLVAPRVVAPGHCTGWRAKAALAGEFAGGRYGPSVVGTLYDLTATSG